MIDDSPDNLCFTFRAAKSGEIFINRHGRKITTLRGAAAQGFLLEINGATTEEQQQIMARLTGNYKRGNERTAGNHPRNRKF